MAEIEDLEALKKKRDLLLNEVGSQSTLNTPPTRPVRSPPTATPTPPEPTRSQQPATEDDDEEDSVPPYNLSLGGFA